MTKSGKLRSYWSSVSNITRKATGTSDEAKETRRVIYKLSGVKIKTFPTDKPIRKALKNFKINQKKRARLYQKEVNQARKYQGRKDKMSLKEALSMLPDYTIDGVSSEDFPSGES